MPNVLQSAMNKVGQALGIAEPSKPAPAKPDVKNRRTAIDLDKIYPVTESNWYKSLPYGFIYTPKDDSGGSKRETLWLPISPQNLTVTTKFATNVVTTLYGVVEQHSENRYYDITIQGTTGYAPRYVDTSYMVDETLYQAAQPKPGRQEYGPEVSINLDAGGFFNQTMEIINQVANRASDAMKKFGGPNSVISGIHNKATGYMAFHNLYRMLMKYKKDAAGELGKPANIQRKFHPLEFVNYKDGVRYYCVPVNFTLVRSAESPMLYNYTIQLKCYNMRPIGDVADLMGDALGDFGVATYGQKIKEQSAFATMQGLAADAKAIIGGISGGFSVLGR